MFDRAQSSSIPQPHLALPPDSLTEYLSKLFIGLRDASLGAKQAAEEKIEEMQIKSEEAASSQIAELEESLAAMQLDLGRLSCILSFALFDYAKL